MPYSLVIVFDVNIDDPLTPYGAAEVELTHLPMKQSQERKR